MQKLRFKFCLKFDYFLVIALIRRIHVEHLAGLHISLRRCHFLHIIHSKRKVRYKGQFSVLSGHATLNFSSGVATIVTDKKGYAGIGSLPLGKYYLVETKTLDGFVLDDTPIEADLSYIDQETEVVYAGMNISNERQNS